MSKSKYVSDRAFTPGFEPDEIACQLVQVQRQGTKQTASLALQLQARLINRYGKEAAKQHIKGTEEAYDLLTYQSENIL